MKKSLIGVVAITCLLSIVAFSQRKSTRRDPCAGVVTQADVNDCSRREYEKADAEINSVYQQLMSSLAEGEGGDVDQQKLKQAQLLWLKYRDADCESEASIYEGGTIRPAVYNLCLASVTRERAKRLKAFLAETRK